MTPKSADIADPVTPETPVKTFAEMSEAEFEELWGGAIGEIQGRDEVVSGIDG